MKCCKNESLLSKSKLRLLKTWKDGRLLKAMFPYFWNTMPPFLRPDFFKYLEIPFPHPFKRILKSQCLITQFFVTWDLKALCSMSDCHVSKYEREFAMLLLSTPELNQSSVEEDEAWGSVLYFSVYKPGTGVVGGIQRHLQAFSVLLGCCISLNSYNLYHVHRRNRKQ